MINCFKVFKRLIRTSKRFIHSKKLFYKLSKEYYPFDLVGKIPETLATYMIDFYENGGIEIIDWYSDEWHTEAKIKMDKCYIWFKWMKPMYLEYSEKILDEAYRRTNELPVEDHFTPTEDPKLFEWVSLLNEEESKKSNIYTEIEDFIYQADQHYMKMMIDIVGFLWV